MIKHASYYLEKEHLKNYQVDSLALLNLTTTRYKLLTYKNGFATSVTGTDWHEVC